MNIPRRLVDCLITNDIKYEILRHAEGFSAQRVAEAEHVKAEHHAKVGMVKSGDRHLMAVLPADRRVDLVKLERITGHAVSLDVESVFGSLFPDCAVGTMPPFGNLYDFPTFVDGSLAQEDYIVFEAGTHTDAIKLGFHDYERIVKPRIADITMKMESKAAPHPPSGASSVKQAFGNKRNGRLIGYRRLLVPIDFSEHSKKTVEYATQLAALTGASIEILHILQMYEYPTGLYRGIYIQPELVKDVVETAQRDANEKLSLVIRDIRAEGLQAKSILRVGTPYEEIVRLANEMDMDLIVIGSHGYRGLGRLLLGSTAERVLQYARCPVLVVKNEPVDRIVAGKDS